MHQRRPWLRRATLTIGLLPLLAAGCSTTSGPSLRPQVRGSAVESSPVPLPPHRVSLPALRTQTFEGRDFTLGKILARNAIYTRYAISYRSGRLKISGIMNLPHGRGPFPVLILNHGYIDPKVYTSGRGLKREQDYLARRGYVVLHPDYRNHADADDDPDAELKFRLGYTEDVINAIVALQRAQLPSVDASRLGMLGHSMGGGVTLNVLVTRPDLVAAAVLFAPVSGDVRDNFERWTKRRPEVVERIIATYGTPDQDPTFWDNLSPLTFAAAVRAPVQIHHGTADDSVPLAWSERLSAVLRAHGKAVTLHTYEGAPHEFIKDWPLVMRRTVEFFDRQLKSPAATPAAPR